MALAIWSSLAFLRLSPLRVEQHGDISVTVSLIPVVFADPLHPEDVREGCGGLLSLQDPTCAWSLQEVGLYLIPPLPRSNIRNN